MKNNKKSMRALAMALLAAAVMTGCNGNSQTTSDADRCRQYRDNPENQERASTYTVMKCMRCMTTCDKKRIKELLK